MKQGKILQKSGKGMAIPIVLLAIVILLILGLAISDTAIQHSILLNRENSSKKAYGQANAGLSQILYYLSTLNGWSNITTDTAPYQSGIFRAGTDLNFYYRLTNVERGADPFTANIQVTGFAEQNGAVLLKRVLNASIHQQNPQSLNAAVFSEGCINSNGNPTITTDINHKVVAFVDASCNGNITVNPPGNYLPLDPNSQTDKEKWYFPHLNDPAVIQLAKTNLLPNWGGSIPQPVSCGGGHYYCSTYLSTQLSGTTFKLKQAIGNLDGTIFIELPSGTHAEIEPPLNSDSIPFPDTGHDFNINPNILIVKGGNLEITGNVTYSGVILVPNGTVKINGSLAVTGAVFTKDGFISGGAGWSVTYDQSYVMALAPFVLKTVVIDSLWESN